MKSNARKWQVVLAAASLAPAITSHAQVGFADDVKLSLDGPNRFRAGAQFLFNVRTEFKHSAQMANPGADAITHGLNRTYDNGYVLLDDSGNVGGETWNWGFEPNATVTGAGGPGTTLQLQTVNTPAAGTSQTRANDPQYGFEVGYGRKLGSFDVGDTRVRWGLDFGFGTSMLEVRNNASLAGMVSRIRDTYDMSALPIIPGAPYYGSAPVVGGPVPLTLPDAPGLLNRTTDTVLATATEVGKVEGNLYGFKIGPFFEVPFTRSLSGQLRAGVLTMLADTKFTYSESISTGRTMAGTTSRDQWLLGGFVDLELDLRLGRGWSAFATVGYQNAGEHELQVGSKSATIKLDSIATLGAGINYSF